MKILIVYASAGGGHKSAALAVRKAFKLKHADVNVETIDILDYTNPFYKISYERTYLFLVNYLSFVWGLFYWGLDNKFIYSLVKPLRRFINGINSGKFVQLLMKNQYDAIISVHFMASEIIGDLKKKNKLSSKLVTVITDYGIHNVWVNDKTDIYIVAYDKTRDELVARGVPAETIKILGIPIDPIFSINFGTMTLRERLGLKPNLFTILIVSGGFGVGPIIRIVAVLEKLTIPHQLIILSGKNQKMLKQLDKAKQNLTVPVKILGYIDNMYDLMEASDLIIGKSGGLTISESLAKHLPIVIVSPIPGQETKNANLLDKYKVAVKTNHIDEIPSVITELFNNAIYLNEIKANIRKVACPNSAADVANFVVHYLTSNAK